jgi:hypothetical protein
MLYHIMTLKYVAKSQRTSFLNTIQHWAPIVVISTGLLTAASPIAPEISNFLNLTLFLFFGVQKEGWEGRNFVLTASKRCVWVLTIIGDKNWVEMTGSAEDLVEQRMYPKVSIGLALTS